MRLFPGPKSRIRQEPSVLRKANEISIKLYELLYFVALHIIVGKVTSNRTYEDIVLPELDFCWYCKMKTVFEP